MTVVVEILALSLSIMLLIFVVWITNRYGLSSVRGWLLIFIGILYMVLTNIVGLFEDQIALTLEGTAGWFLMEALLRIELGALLVVYGLYRWMPQALKSKEDEAKLRTERNMALLYLDLMGHDIRNNLHVVSMSKELMTDMISEPVASTMLENIGDAVSKCDEIIAKVKATADLPGAPMTIRNLRSIVVQKCESFTQENSNVVASLEVNTDMAIILADEYLESLLDNLLQNSVEHNPREDKCVWITLDEDDSGYWLHIADNGPGIPDDRRGGLFDMTTRYGGVGLHQSKHIAEKFGGIITVHERIEGDHTQGVVFEVFFPRAEKIENIAIHRK